MKRPSSRFFEQQLMAQRAQQQAALASESAAFAAQRAQSQGAAAAMVASEEAALRMGVRKAARRPVGLGTLLTSSQGLLGNPVLSGTKLGA